MVKYGRTCPEGFLPVFSVGTEKEAQSLITLVCQTDLDGNHVARELIDDQTLENLEAFSKRVDEAHDHMIERGLCQCPE